MKISTVFNLLTLLGLALALPTYESEKTLKRVARDTLFLHDGAFSELQSEIVQSCKSNGYSVDDLQETYGDLVLCLGRKPIAQTPKDEYLSHLDQCAAEAVKQTKNCLPENKKYLPEFLLDLAKSAIGFLYDDYYLIVHGGVGTCISSINLNSIKPELQRCLVQSGQQDSNEIPSSKKKYCQILRASSECFSNILRDHCTDTWNLRNFRNDYIRAMVKPCES